MKLRLPILVLLVLSLPLRAAELAGVSMPDEIDFDGKTLVLNGLGLREASMLKVDVYVAGLYLEQKSGDAQAILDSPGAKAIRMAFVRKVKEKSIREAWEEGFEKNAGSELDALSIRVNTLNSWMTDFVKGDTIGFTHVPGRGVLVELDGTPKGIIVGDDFARVLWSIWLGPEPPNPGIKSGMLGEK